MRAEVFHSATEYTYRDRWSSPEAIWIDTDSALIGVARRVCPDCGGTGHFPVPWRGPGAPPADFDIGDDACVRCKSSGLELVAC